MVLAHVKLTHLLFEDLILNHMQAFYVINRPHCLHAAIADFDWSVCLTLFPTPTLCLFLNHRLCAVYVCQHGNSTHIRWLRIIPVSLKGGTWSVVTMSCL
jgi:hypothetical protein